MLKMLSSLCVWGESHPCETDGDGRGSTSIILEQHEPNLWIGLTEIKWTAKMRIVDIPFIRRMYTWLCCAFCRIFSSSLFRFSAGLFWFCEELSWLVAYSSRGIWSRSELCLSSSSICMSSFVIVGAEVWYHPKRQPAAMAMECHETASERPKEPHSRKVHSLYLTFFDALSPKLGNTQSATDTMLYTNNKIRGILQNSCLFTVVDSCFVSWGVLP